MRLTRCARTASAACIALLGSAPLAGAVATGVVAVTPGSAAPGQTVTVSATGCITTGNSAISRASSNAFPTATLTAVAGAAAGTVSGTSTVFTAAKPGTYPVTVVCDVDNPVQQATGSLTVVATGTGAAGTGDEASYATSGPLILGGAAVTVASLGAGVHALRRRAGARC